MHKVHRRSPSFRHPSTHRPLTYSCSIYRICTSSNPFIAFSYIFPPLNIGRSFPHDTQFIGTSPIHIDFYDRLEGHLQQSLFQQVSAGRRSRDDQSDGARDVQLFGMDPRRQTGGAGGIRVGCEEGLQYRRRQGWWSSRRGIHTICTRHYDDDDYDNCND